MRADKSLAFNVGLLFTHVAAVAAAAWCISKKL